MLTRSTWCGLAAAIALSFSAVAMAQTTGSTSSPNPPGTAASRAFDRAAGTDTSGAYPAQRDGTKSNPRGTASERAFDRAAGTNTNGAYPSQSDATRANPSGTDASRSLDRTTTSNR